MVDNFITSILHLLIILITAINFNISIFVLSLNFFYSSANINVWTCTYNQGT